MAEETHLEQQFLEHIVSLIVTDPDQIVITRSVDDLGVLITLKVSAEDMGRIIGKEGQTAKAIRTLLRVIGSRNNLRVNLKILEPEDSQVPRPTPLNEAGLDDDGDTTLEAPEVPEEIEAPASSEESTENTEDTEVSAVEGATEGEETPETAENDSISFDN